MDANLTKTYVTDNLFYKVEYEISYFTQITVLFFTGCLNDLQPHFFSNPSDI